MRTPLLLAFAATATTWMMLPGSAAAGPVGSACLASDRPGASRSLCACIQAAADDTLGHGDQRQAAKLFRDPELAQEIRASASSGGGDFWDRYRQFAARAEALCR